MTAQVKIKIEEILTNENKLNSFAIFNRLETEAMRRLLEELLKEPELSEKVKEYVFSSERSEDFKAFYAGEEKGYAQGHEAGFAKGAALAITATLSMLTLAGLAYLNSKN